MNNIMDVFTSLSNMTSGNISCKKVKNHDVNNLNVQFKTTINFVGIEENELLGGSQYKFLFENGYGASVVRHFGSYGGNEGLWELAVLGKDGELNYDTEITDDVVGWLNEVQVVELLEKINKLQ